TYLAVADGSAALVPASPVGGASLTASCWYSPGTITGQGAFAVQFCNGPNLNLLCVRPSDYQVGVYNNGFLGSGAVLTAGSWYHLAVSTYVAGSTVTTTVYVNARAAFTTTGGFNPATYPITCIGNTGAGNSATAGQASVGRLADVRVWARTLSAGEMEMVYSQSTKPVFRDVNTGFVGVNLGGANSPPAYAVDVNGAVRASTTLLAGTSTDTTSQRAISALQSGLAAGGATYITLGQAASANNQAELAFTYAGAGSAANTLSLGFYGAALTSGRLFFTAAGQLGVGTSTPGFTCDVAGTLRATGATTVGGALGVAGPATLSAGANVTGTLAVTGACRASADSLLNTAAIGALGYGSWAGFTYSGLPATGFALLQSAAGQTILNNVAGQGTLFRDSNATGMTYTNAALRVGDGAAPTQTLDVAGSMRVSGRTACDRRADPLDNGAVLQWVFQEGAGTTVYDRSPTGTNGTISGAFTWSSAQPYDGLRGAYVNFTDQSGYITPSAPVGFASLTASVWYQPSAASTAFNDLFWSGPYRNLMCVQTSSMTLGFYNNGFVDSGAVLAVGSWYHLTAVTWPSGGSSAIALFVNGRAVLSTTSGTFSSATYPIVGVAGNAGAAAPTSGQACQGKVEDVRVWARALSAGEVGKVYGNKIMGPYRDLNTGFVGFGGQTQPAHAVDVTGNVNYAGSLLRNGVQAVQAFTVAWTGGSVPANGGTRTQTVAFPSAFPSTGAVVHVQVVGAALVFGSPSAVTATNFVATAANASFGTANTPSSLMIIATLGT
ncbi:MAG: LamG domain-containing protein, partial [Propionibacteriaceae bacterium]